MARTISPTLLNAMYAEQTGIVVICLLTISHPSIADIRLSSNATTKVASNPLQYKTVSRGDDYLFAPFSITLPDDVEGQAPVCNFMIENISRDLIAIVRSVDLTQGAPTLTIELVTSRHAEHRRDRISDLRDPQRPVQRQHA